MILQKEREQIVKFGRKLLESGLVRGTSGNISICDKERRLIAITPSGMSYTDITESDIVILNLSNEQKVDSIRMPSSELAMHTLIYKKRSDVCAIVHTHSIYATVLGTLGWTLPATHYMVAVAGKEVRCANYATFGTQALAKNAYETMQNDNAVILANHGLLACGKNIAEAFTVAEEVEICAKIYCKAKQIGNPNILADEEMSLMCKKFASYGQGKSQ